MASLQRYAAFIGRRTLSTSSTATRPFKVLGLQQVAVGGLDKGKLAHLWSGLLGLPKATTYRSEKENVDEDVLVLGRGVLGSVELDIMQPINKDKSPKVHDPSLNHIGLWVDNLPAAVAWLQSQGVRFTPGGIRKGASGYDVCFIHPKGSAEAGAPQGGEGVLIELVQAPPEVIVTYTMEAPPKPMA